MMKYMRTLTAAALVLGLALALPAGQSVQRKPRTQTATDKSQTPAQPSAMDYRRDATETFDQAFPKMTTLMATTAFEADKTIKPWDEWVNNHCGTWSNTVDLADKAYLEKSAELPASWLEWRKDNDEFIGGEIQSAGRDVVSWRSKTYLEIYALQYDIDSHPIRKEEWLKNMTEAEKLLEAAEGTAKDAAATVKAVEKSRADVSLAKNLVDNVTSDLGSIRTRVLQNHGAEVKMDAKIAAIQARWTVLKDQYPQVLSKWKESVAGWAKNIKTAYESHEKVRKQFDTLFEPVMNQKLFAGLRLFQGKEYKDLSGIVDKLDEALQLRWAKAHDKSRNEEELAKAIVQERETSALEFTRMKELLDITGGQRERQEVLKYINAADSAAKRRGLKLNIASRENSLEEQKAAEEELRKYELKSLPEQVAAQKVWDDYQKQKKDAEAEIKRLETSRASRLKKLGLPPDPDWRFR